jgi:hypothetical protein
MRYKAIRHYLWIGSFFFLSLLYQYAFATATAFTATVDREQMGVGETLTLTLSLQGDANNAVPDLSALSRAFKILATQQAMKMSNINGKTDVITQWVVTLVPQQTGQIRIPSFSLGQLHTQAITIDVVAHHTTQVAGDVRPIFMRATVDTKQPYVQSQLIYTVKIFYAINLIRATLTDPAVADAVVLALGKDANYQTTVAGQAFHVLERRFAIFPQKSGELIIKSPVLTGSIADATQPQSTMQQFFSTGGRPIQLTAAEEKVQVQAKPKDVTTTWLPAEKVDIRENWSQHPRRFEVGQAITRQITVTAKGLTGAQLPAIDLTNVAQLNTYPDQAVVDSKVQDGSIVGMRREKIAYVATQAGEVHLPEVVLPWWNTQTKQAELAVLPARTVTVLPAATNKTAAASPLAAAQQTSTNVPSNTSKLEMVSSITSDDKMTQAYWPWLAGGFFVLWLATLLLFLRRRWQKTVAAQELKKNTPAQASLAQVKAGLKQACEQNAPKIAAALLKDWACLMWPGVTMHHLADIAQQVNDSELAALILALDKQLYKTSLSVWQGQTFWLALNAYKIDKQPPVKAKTEDLPSLYCD